MSESNQPAASSSTSPPTNTGAAAVPSAAGAAAPTSAASGQTAPLMADATPEIFNALRNLIMSQTGGPVTNDKVSNLLLTNMTTLVSQGKLTQKQILLLKDYADSTRITTGAAPLPAAANTLKAGPGATAPPTAAGVAQGIKASTSSGSNTPATAPTPTASSSTAPATANSNLPTLQSSVDFYPAISATLNTTNPGPVQWAQTRPTLTGGVPSGRLSGTPAQVARSLDDPNMLVGDDAGANGANGGAGKRRKSTPGDQSMRRTIQDLVASVDPNVKIEPEVEDLLLSIADEFIDSVTNFSCRLAKHRGGDTLEVRDLQLHLERNHNIRIPGFSSDETRISLSQNNLGALAAAAGGTGGGTGKKGAQGGNMTLRAQRLAQVQQAKREGKLM